MDEESRLLRLFGDLSSSRRILLLEFAEFLVTRKSAPGVPARSGDGQVAAPEPVARPENETIVAGLKRLSRTYPMLDKTEMLRATSDLVATHLLQGTEATLVIDQLEDIFREHYEQLLAAGRNP